ncbi:hypothetical protein [Cellulomonas biazotea]|uniref:Uncharacterized protein n=1 Tax=Cellulomonas biazotea TaxID=1709 RepID=A0A402DPI7_9CELL|nr:hypothetical protein [Cellulomonas biazotea]GCE76006.1 hypothetical protein CBZ_10620 [Cellulomonas biazotea]
MAHGDGVTIYEVHDGPDIVAEYASEAAASQRRDEYVERLYGPDLADANAVVVRSRYITSTFVPLPIRDPQSAEGTREQEVLREIFGQDRTG